MNQPAVGVAAGAVGSTIAVCNLSSSALNTPGDSGIGDPWAAYAALDGEQQILSSVSSESGVFENIAGSVPNHANIRPIITPFGQYANFYHIWRGNDTVTTAPRIQVFGRVKKPLQAAGGLQRWPNDDDPDFPNVVDFWIPLLEPGETNHYMEFGTAAAGRYTNRMFISKPRYVYLQGVEEIIVMITQAAAFSATQLVTMSSGGSTATFFSSSSSSASDASYGLIGVQLSG